MFWNNECRAFYKTAFWRELSKVCKQRDNFACRKCGDTTGILHAHHRISRRPVPHPTGLDRLENLITLCDRCHAEEHPHMTVKNAPPKMFRASRYRRF